MSKVVVICLVCFGVLFICGLVNINFFHLPLWAMVMMAGSAGIWVASKG